jgi:Zn-dependent protease
VFLVTVCFCSLLFATDLPDIQALPAGIGTALLLYLAIVLHECAHGIAGRMVGLPVHAITLFGFGGRTEVDETHLLPLNELLVAVAGPLMSLLLTIGWGITYLASTGPLQIVALTQTWMNAGLLALNLLPGYPLDGGRILKASLWFLGDHEIPAARLATLIARTCSWVLMIVGLLYALTSGDLLYALVLATLGLFLGHTAIAGFRQLTLQRALVGVHVADLMSSQVRSVEPNLSLDQFVARFVLGQADTCFPVVAPVATQAPPLLGMITMRNLRSFPISTWAQMHIHEAMLPVERVCILTPTMPADHALHLLITHDLDLLPVVQDTLLIGVLRRRDVLLHIQVALANFHRR